jgi:hypothetical protein
MLSGAWPDHLVIAVHENEVMLEEAQAKSSAAQ